MTNIIPSEGVLILVGINIILTLSFYVMISAGQLSLGNAAFMAIGAYVSGIATVKWGVSLPLAMVMAAVAGGVIGVLVGFPGLRVSGLYLAMLTIGVNAIVLIVLKKIDYIGGNVGLTGMHGTNMTYVYVTLLLITLFLWRVRTSRLGLAFRAVKRDELVADSMGLNPTVAKLLAFGIGSAIAAVGGALYAHFMFYINPDNFDIRATVAMVLPAILGGADSLLGVILGTIVWTLLPEYIRFVEQWRVLLFGSLVVLIMAIRPQGTIEPAMERHFARFVRRATRRFSGRDGVPVQRSGLNEKPVAGDDRLDAVD